MFSKIKIKHWGRQLYIDKKVAHYVQGKKKKEKNAKNLLNFGSKSN